MEPKARRIPALVVRAAIGALIFFVALLVGIAAAHAAEIVPAIGISKATDGSGETKSYLGLAVRGNLVPLFKHELAVAYRSDEYYNGDLKVHTVPVTASIWFAPIPMLYAGGGAGLYMVSLSYRDALLIPDKSESKFGVHLGAGLNFPLAPMLSVDLNSRYVFMEEQATALTQGSFNPDYWATSVGVAIKF